MPTASKAPLVRIQTVEVPLRWFATLLLATVLAVALAACSDDSSGSGESGIERQHPAKPGDSRNGEADPPPIPGSPREDLDALVALYEAFGERPGWADDAESIWDVPPEEEPFGVIPDENGRIVGLLLSNSLFSGEIPPEVGSLTALRWLDLGANQLSGKIPSELGNLVNLEGLKLGLNLLTGEIPSELGNLTSLRQLSLGSNQLSGEIPSELGNLANLEGLSLRRNLLTGEIPSELGSLVNLESLDLAVNQLTGDLPAELGGLTSLRWLNLRGNDFALMPEKLRKLAMQNGLEINDIYVRVSTAIPYSTVEALDNDDEELTGLLDQATKCRRGLRFPEDSFCVGGGRYILAHDARGRIVVRDLLWQESDSPATFESLFRALDEREIPGFIAAAALSANFSSPEGNFTIEESNTPATINAPDKRIVITSHRYDFELLSDAVSEGNPERLRSLVEEEGADVNAIGRNRRSVLHRAIEGGNPEMVGALLELGANPDTRNDFGSPIIKWAAELGNADVVRLLVDAGSDVDAGAALWTAVSYGHTEVVRLLVDAGADVNLKDNLWNSDPSGGSLLDMAKWNSNSEIVQILVDAGAKATEGVTVVEEGHFPEAVEDRYPATASGLYGAVADGDVAAVRHLVEAGVDVDAKAAGGESILNNAVMRAGPEIVQVLVDGGADVNAEDNLGRSVLYEAVEFDPDPEIVQILVVAGADVNFKYDDGGPILRSILYEAGRNFDPNPEVVRVLVDAGADVNEIIYEGRSILYEMVTDSRANPEVVRILVEAGADVNAIDDDGRSILYQAVTYSLADPEIVRILVYAGADVNFKHEYGDPILFQAATGFEPNPEIVRILVEAGADVNARDWSGTSALTAAKGRGNLDVARILTEAGAVE